MAACASGRSGRVLEPCHDVEEATLQVEGLLAAEKGDSPPALRRQRRVRALAAGLLGVAAVLAIVVVAIRKQSVPAGDGEAVVTLSVVAQCAGEGGDCHASQCCLDGGAKGLQCWQKNKFYAVCIQNETCQKGVHPGETHGNYDQHGSFHLDSWSCEKLGNRSLPSCSTYGEAEDCPEARCDWFRTGKCLPKCANFYSKEACPSEHCTWDGSTCAVDPCSAPGEDCASTKCCSSARGAKGQQCFQKNEDWSTCLDVCDSNTTQKGWSCEKIGERTPFPAPCSWAGKDCSKTHCCGNPGFSCVVKDESYTGCVQTMQHTTWMDNPIKLPAGWKGTVLGKWMNEYQVAPAPPGAPLQGVSMFCFMAVLPNSTEMALMEVSKKNWQSIFACNESAVFHSWNTNMAGWDTSQATLVNTAVFFKVWDLVKQDGRYLKYDWTIKVDADCAFIPSRLASHLWTLRVPLGAAVYIKNTNEDVKLTNGQFLGAIEVFSKQAVQTYFDNEEGCQTTMGKNSGEDGFFKGCMDALGIGYMHDGEMLKPDFAASYCRTAGRAAFHPLKDPPVLQNCYNAVMGKPIDWSHNTAPGVAR